MWLLQLLNVGKAMRRPQALKAILHPAHLFEVVQRYT
jgi:hypothetical protein